MFGLLSFVFSGLGAISSYKAGKAQIAEQQRQSLVKQRLNAVNERRAKINAFKERRRAEAEVVQQGVVSGANFTASTGFQGGIASIGSQFASNQQFVNQVNNLNSQLGTDYSKIGKYQGQAQLFGAAAGLFGETLGGNADISSFLKGLGG